jgi:hypothetical protein
MKYKIIHVSGFSVKKSLAKLEKLVNEQFELGWEPVGGVARFESNFAQAIVKRR